MGKNLAISYLIDCYGGVLTEKQRDALEQYYNHDLSLAEIAENQGISRQGVRDAIVRGEGILLELEEKVGAVAKGRVLQSCLAEMEALCREVTFRNSSGYMVAEEFNKHMGRLLQLIQSISQ